ILFQQEGAVALPASGENKKQIRHLAKCDPLLVPGEHKIVAALDCFCPDFTRITAAYTFGESECADPLPLPKLFQPLHLLGFRPPARYGQSDHAVNSQ